jgi:peptide/nickel transport system substrate-binding protein
MKKHLCAIAMLALSLTVAACGGSSNNNSNTVASSNAAGSAKSYPELKWGMIAFPGPIDWSKNPWNQAASIESLVVQNLVELGPNGEVKPALASSVEHPNATTYIYNIKSGVKFSDGKPLTVADVLYSLKRNLVGQEVWLKTYWEDVSSISAQGSSAVAVKLKHPYAPWPAVVGSTSPIIEKAAAEKAGEKALGTPAGMLVGTGPWKFDSIKPEVSVQLSSNPYWKGPQRPAQRISINIFKQESSEALALRSGAIDGTFSYLSPKTFDNIPGTRQLAAPGINLVTLAINTSSAPFNDVHVRRAIAYATNVKGMINALFPGQAEEAITVSSKASFANLGSASEVASMLSALPKYEFNLAAAKQELAKSAYPHGFATEVEANVNEQDSQLVAQVLASDLSKIGIIAKVHVVPLNETSNLYGKKITIWANEYFSVYPDADSLMSSLLPSAQIRPPGSGFNSAEFRNTEVDKLVQAQAQAENKAQRLKLVHKLLDVIGAEEPYRPVYTSDVLGRLSEKYVFSEFSAWTALFRPWALEVKLAS